QFDLDARSVKAVERNRTVRIEHVREQYAEIRLGYAYRVLHRLRRQADLVTPDDPATRKLEPGPRPLDRIGALDCQFRIFRRERRDQRLAAFGLVEALRQAVDGLLVEHDLGFRGNDVAEDTDAGGFHLDQIAGLQPARWIEPRARPGRGAGCDHVARLQRREGRKIGDQEIERKHQPLGGIVLAHLAVDAGDDIVRPARIAFVGTDDPRPDAAGAIEILALRDVELAVMQPVAHAALVAQRHAEDVVEGVLARDMAARLPAPRDEL